MEWEKRAMGSHGGVVDKKKDNRIYQPGTFFKAGLKRRRGAEAQPTNFPT